MNRKQFIESQGATCKNWTWSWSFINEPEKFIIFGAWDKHDDGNCILILRENWATNQEGRKQPGYTQAREHLRFLEEEKGYQLKIFLMEYDEDEGGSAKIKGFIPKLRNKELKHCGDSWYAMPLTNLNTQHI